MIEFPGIADIFVAIAVGSSATLCITLISAFVALHLAFYKLMPIYCFLVGLLVLFNFPGILHYTPPVLKSLQELPGTDGVVLLKLLSVLLLGYGAAVYHVGQSKCATTKAINALLFSVGTCGVWVAMSGQSSYKGFLATCTNHAESGVAFCTVTGSLIVAAGHYMGPAIEDYLSHAGCQARAKVVVNSHGPRGR